MKYVSIFWEDIRVYYRDEKHSTSFAFTEGYLFAETDRYLIIKNPETVLVGDRVRNHPEKKAKFYCIPRSLIKDITYVR